MGRQIVDQEVKYTVNILNISAIYLRYFIDIFPTFTYIFWEIPVHECVKYTFNIVALKYR